LPEGEKDVDLLAKLGLVATTNSEGAGKWRDEYTATLKGRHVAIVPDNDEEGRAHMEQIAERLDGVATELTLHS
jgi:putative DNA primase/helicase